MKKQLKKLLIITLILVSILSILTGCNNNQTQYYKSATELDGKAVAVWPGSKFETEIIKAFPDIEPIYLGEINVSAEALIQNKIAALGYDKAFLKFINNMGYNFTTLPDFSTELLYGCIFSSTEKGLKLREEFNKYLAVLKETGELKRLQDKFIFSGNEYGPEYTLNSWDTSAGEITISTTALAVPFSYLYNDELSGYETSLVYGFAKENHYKVITSIGTFEAMLADVDSGKSDIGFQTIEITDERKEIIAFSDPTYIGEMVFFVQKDPLTMPEFQLNQLNGKRFASVAGSIDYVVIDELFQDSEIFSYNNANDTITAIKSNKADYCLINTNSSKVILEETEGLAVLDEPVYTQHFGIAFQKDTPDNDLLQSQFDELITNYKNSGVLDEMEEGWLNDSDNRPMPIINVTDDAKKITAAVILTEAPLNYVRNGENAGYDIELFYRFCNEYNYKPDFFVSDFSGILPAVTTGKADLGIANICITEERAQSVDFSLAYLDEPYSVLVRSIGNQKGFIDKLKDSFYKTFIKENRYQLILQGIVTTIEITVFSTILGTLLGAILYSITRKQIKILNKILEIISKISNGLPMVVILMILCYIIFGKSDISGIYIAIIGFSITLALDVFPSIATAVNAIDKGQLEGAYAIGFTDRQAFNRIILPQALKIFIPGYTSTLVGLLKGTAIVGYVAVQDLTKMSELIRARTYEAFFPLIVTAVIYLIIGLILSYIIKSISKLFTPELRSKEKILKQYKK